jgi:hypothetical protein
MPFKDTGAASRFVEVEFREDRMEMKLPARFGRISRKGKSWDCYA